jgi:hypothetical protein
MGTDVAMTLDVCTESGDPSALRWRKVSQDAGRCSGQCHQLFDAVVGNDGAPPNEASGIATTTKEAPHLVQEALIPDFRA